MPQDICIVVTVPMAANVFLADLIARLAAQGWKVTIVVNTKAGEVSPQIRQVAEVVHLGIHRRIAPLADLGALLKLWWFFRRRRFAVVHSMTPKAGLLAMVAARFAGVPVRIHMFTGQVWVTRHGMQRFILKSMDRVLAFCATALLADSASQRTFLIQQSVVSEDRIETLGHGSVCGIDTTRFAPNAEARGKLRTELAIPPDAVVYIYVGRFSRDKGLLELTSAFRKVASALPNVYCLLVGPDEENLTAQIQAFAGEAAPRLRFVGMTRQPERYMTAADLFCLASYREGFGAVLIEAAATGLPSIATRIYGITDAVVDGTTGLLVPVRDVNAMAEAMHRLATDEALRKKMGEAGRERATTLFASALCLDEWIGYYTRHTAQLHATH